jgi:hypothetical protein
MRFAKLTAVIAFAAPRPLSLGDHENPSSERALSQTAGPG